MHRSRLFAISILLCLAALHASAAGDRVALVIGNAAYPEAALTNPKNDARDVAAALREVGFDVIHREDASHREMLGAFRDFGTKIQRGGVGLFYYAGHGVQVKGRNYLLPIDADVQSVDEIDYPPRDPGRV